MKTIHSLKEFYQRTLALAEQKGIDYVSVKTEITTYGGILFSCYAHGYAWCNGKTMQEALDKLYSTMHPFETADIKDDVEVDAETASEPNVHPIFQPLLSAIAPR